MINLYSTYIKNSNLPYRYHKDIELFVTEKTEGAFNRLDEIKNNINDFVKAGDNLYIWSHVTGSGKTTWASILLKKYIANKSDKAFNANTPAYFINVIDLLALKKASMNSIDARQELEKTEYKIKNSKLVVFDDIGMTTLSEYELTYLFAIIGHRLDNLKSCIFTSNLDPKDLAGSVGERLADRITSYSEIIGFSDKYNFRGLEKENK